MSKKMLILCNIALLLALAVFATLYFTAGRVGVSPEEPPEWKALTMSHYTEEQIKELEEELTLRASLWHSHGVPGDDHISMGEALERSKQALIQQKELSEEELGAYLMLPYFITEQGSFVTVGGKQVPLPAPYWQMNYRGGPLTLYSVYLDPKTGDVLWVSGPEDGNG